MDANERRARATDEAAQWWTRLGTRAPAEVSAADRQEFTQWLRESPLHVAELLQVAHVHDSLERFRRWDEIAVSPEEVAANVIPLSKFKHTADVAPTRPRTLRWLAAASFCLLAVAAGWLTLRSGATVIETERAERREVVLNDGTVVNLEPETAVRVLLGKDRRYVILARGRALFHVAKDPSRPFIVHAGDTNVRAVGTIFGIERRHKNIIVTVAEGKVGVIPSVALAAVAGNTFKSPAAQRATPPTFAAGEQPDSPGSGTRPTHATAATLSSARGDDSAAVAVSSAESSGGPSERPGEVFLSANQQITVHTSGEATPIQKVDSSRALAWSEGRLVFDSTALSDVADEFNRYNRVQLHIEGAELAQRTVSGVFRASDPETLVDFIGAGAHVVITRRGDAEIVISPGP